MSPRTNRLVDLFWNIFIVGLVNLFLDFAILYIYHEGVDYFAYIIITIITTFIMAIISSVVVFVRIKDRAPGKFIYALIAFILSLILFYFTTAQLVPLIPHWIFP